MDTTETAKCQDCGRKITAAASIAAGRGSGCRAKVRAAARAAARAAVEAAKPAQLAKAIELIEDAGIIRVSAFYEFAAKSGDGLRTYLVDVPAETCNCMAGERGRYCYHLLAGQILTAAAGRPVRTAARTLALAA